MIRSSSGRGNPGRVPSPSRDGLRRAKPGSVHAYASLAALAATVAATAAWAAAAPSGQVVVLEPIGSSQIARHCLTRVREELTAGGFEVSSVDSGPRRDPVSLARSMEAQAAVAVIALSGDPGQPGAELWILDRVGATPEVRRVPASSEDPEHLPEVLAIRTIEVLKASALKLLVEASATARAPAPSVVRATPPAPPPPAAGPPAFGLEAGISVLESVGGPGPAALPLTRARVRLGDSLSARLTIAALGSRPRVHALAGSASVAQSFGMAELALGLRPGHRWRPVLTVGAGALRVESSGDGISPYKGVEETRWVAALDAGAGVLATFGTNFSATLELHALLAVPHPTVRFDGVDRATIGFPAILASLTMVAWL
jgi:hypothetical protein